MITQSDLYAAAFILWLITATIVLLGWLAARAIKRRCTGENGRELRKRAGIGLAKGVGKLAAKGAWEIAKRRMGM